MTYTHSAIVTGGTQGLGYHTARIIAKAHPDFLVVITARSDKLRAAETINKALGQSNTIFLPIDLADMASVRRFVGGWAASSHPPIQALVMNAGLQFPAALILTEEGMEKTFAISHTGHAVLFHLLYPYLATGARVVLTSSGTHDPAQKSGMPDAEYTSAEDLAYPPKRTADIPGRKRYSTAKLCNVLWTYALARRLVERAPERRITVNAMDPGLMPGTGLARQGSVTERWLWKSVLPHMLGLLRIIFSPNVHTPEESAEALARLAIGADVEGVTGKYFEGLREIKSSSDSYVESKQEDLWCWTINYAAQGNETEVQRFESLK